MQCVEEKVGVQLHLKRHQPCFLQMFFESGFVQFLGMHCLIVIDSMTGRDDHGINEQVDGERFQQQWKKCCFEKHFPFTVLELGLCNQEPENDIGNAGKKTSRDVDGEGTLENGLTETDTRSEPPDGGGEHTP